MSDMYLPSMAALMTERDRYRRALEEIREWWWVTVKPFATAAEYPLLVKADEIASKALAGTEEK